jgi:predicted NUDIX family NTP pyrophosphohydrolase
MPRSAGLLLYRQRPGGLEVLLVHLGGPFWAKRDLGAWSIPKGELSPGEEPLAAARREAAEELGAPVEGPMLALTPIRQRGGKDVLAWAVEADWNPATLQSNHFELEWPPRSGRRQQFPEVDRAAWFTLPEAAARIVSGQRALLDEVARLLGNS